jgi:hypothetical protein
VCSSAASDALPATAPSSAAQSERSADRHSQRPRRVPPAALALLLACILSAHQAHAGSLRYCDNPPTLTAAQQDRLLRVSALIRRELEQSGSTAAVIARSGLNLRWFDMRYSHAGLSLQRSADTPWAVRQLYFSCDEKAPRLFDQGLSAFLLGTEDPDLGFVSIVTLPQQASRRLEPVALDNPAALSLLARTYSANAYAWSTTYQNCNQWLIELMGLAWNTGPVIDSAPRATAQAWLRQQGYEAATFSVGWRPILWLTGFSPYLNRDDHPEADLAQAQLRVSMPESIEAFVRRLHPEAMRIELCHTREHVVLRRGGEPLNDGCVPGPTDTLVPLT